MSKGGFADQQCRRVIAQAQAGGMLDGEGAIRADFARLDLQVMAERLRDYVRPGKSAHRRAAYAHNGPARRLAIEHSVEINDTVNFGEGHAQRATHFCRNRFGEPAVKLLSGV